MTNKPRPTRRAVVGGMAAGTMATMAGRESSAQAQTKTFVLVHGAWHGGWCWRRVSDLLEKRGHKVFTPTLTGLGERSHLLDEKVSLTTHVTDLVNVIKWEDLKDIVLCGHSYGGLIVSGVAEQAPVASIVFLDAFVPENGEALAELASQPVREAIAAASQKGDIALKPVPAAVFRVNERDRAWVDALCTPHPIATLKDKISLTGARERIAKKAYIRAKGYPSMPFDAAHAKLSSSAGWRVYDVPCGHDVMVDMPERLVEILLEVS